MAHATNITHPAGPDAPHALDLVPLKPRKGTLDAKCPICHGHGEWNAEIDLVSFRCKRAVCDRCAGAGWVETGSDPVGFPDIALSAEGTPQWVVDYVPRADVDDDDIGEGNLLAD